MTIMQYFEYDHLPPALQARSKPFHDLAQWLASSTPPGAELNVALRRLLEAKDCAVRASLPPREAIRPRMPDLGGMPSVARDWPNTISAFAAAETAPGKSRNGISIASTDKGVFSATPASPGFYFTSAGVKTKLPLSVGMDGPRPQVMAIVDTDASE